LFDDALFVKTRQGMLPTAFAEEISNPIAAGLASLRLAMETRRSFVPESAERTFYVYMSDLGQAVFIPRLIAHMRTVAPGIRVVTVDRSFKDAQEAMALGHIDLAIGMFLNFDKDFYQQRLFQESYVAMVRVNHPDIRNTLDAGKFLRAEHVAYSPTAGSHAAFEAEVDDFFHRHDVHRKVAVRLAHSLGLAQIIASSDLVACVPSRLAATMLTELDIRTFPLPFETTALPVSQLWHLRFRNDEGHKWLRSVIYELFQETALPDFAKS
jgi:DNA-binding transcriptional LysR family regulator